MLTVMSKSEYLIIRFKGTSENHAVRICIGVVIEEISVSKIGDHYFLISGECEIGFPLKVLKKLVDFTQYSDLPSATNYSPQNRQNHKYNTQ